MAVRVETSQQILGYPIRSRTHIYVSYIIPPCCGLVVYIVQFFADCAVSYQHFRNGQRLFGWLTLLLILAPPFLCFLFVVTSPEQWTNPRHAKRINFIGYQLANLVLFPIFASYRFAKRIFWAIESLFHDNDQNERMNALEKSSESSTCEVYYLLQAYTQSAPQIILQLYHMLSEDLFRDYNTTTVQGISLVFSAIDLAAITVTYQRFESQKLVGRPYPWANPTQIRNQRRTLESANVIQEQIERSRRESERKISQFPESDAIMERFRSKHSETHSQNSNEEEYSTLVKGYDEHFDMTSTERPFPQSSRYLTDDDKINLSKNKNNLETRSRTSIRSSTSDGFATNLPPMHPPNTFSDLHNHPNVEQNPFSATTNRLSTYKDMLLLNAQLYINEKVPRPPKMLTRQLSESAPQQSKETSVQRPTSNRYDEVDFFLPHPHRVVNGIGQDDFAGRTVAFLGWLAFITMRMLALSTFCVFYPLPFFIIMLNHYGIMLMWLLAETKFKAKLNRTLFYLVLAYVFIFVILEFRVQFKRIRLWLIGYFVIIMTENLVMTYIWWLRAEFESWWFGFMQDGILYSGIIFSVTLVVYYYILKPKEIVIIVVDK